MRRVLAGLFVLLLTNGLALASALNSEQKDVQMFIKELYSIDSLTFEMGEFGKNMMAEDKSNFRKNFSHWKSC